MNFCRHSAPGSSEFMNAITNLSSCTSVEQPGEHGAQTRTQLEFPSELSAAPKSCSASSPTTNQQPEASLGQSLVQSKDMEEATAAKYGRGALHKGTRTQFKSPPGDGSEAGAPVSRGRLSGLHSGLTKCGRTRVGGENDSERVTESQRGQIRSTFNEEFSGDQTEHEAISEKECCVESNDPVSESDSPTGKKRKQSSPPWKCSIIEHSIPHPKVSKVIRLFNEPPRRAKLCDSHTESIPSRHNADAQNELPSKGSERQESWKSPGITGALGDALWRSSSWKPKQVLKRKRPAPVEDSRSVHEVSRSPAISCEIQVTRSESFSTQQEFSSLIFSGSAESSTKSELPVARLCPPTLAGDTRCEALSISDAEAAVSGGKRNTPSKTGTSEPSSPPLDETPRASSDECFQACPNETTWSSPNRTSRASIRQSRTSPNGSLRTSHNGSSRTSPDGSSRTPSDGSSRTSFNGNPASCPSRPSSAPTDRPPTPTSKAPVGSPKSPCLPSGQPSSSIHEGPQASLEQSSPCTTQSQTSSIEGPAAIPPRQEASLGQPSNLRSPSPPGVSSQLPSPRTVRRRGGATCPASPSLLAERQPAAASAATTTNVVSGQGERREGNEGEATPTLEAAKCIQAIDRAAVHRICSGQVVVNLATAVKELVENSLDAGSRCVEVRLTDHGASSVVVSDDGPGVHPKDFEALALKHHTSKLRDFSDVCGIATYGFRGEALSSLCALSSLTVCTRHASQPLASLLTYDRDGKLVLCKPASRQVGTTVTLNGLFSSLPVRRREFERNLKKEYHKMVQVLYSYAIISTNIRLHVVNHSDGRRTTVLSTSCFGAVRDNVEALFGPKQMKTLLPIEERAALTCGDEVDDDSKGDLRLEGYVSSCCHGLGRSAPDRQFYFVNSRPCDPVKVSRLVNELYHTYNRHQYPFVVLNVCMERSSVDVNLTPDKRQVMMHNEKLLLTTIKNSLLRLYEDIPKTLPLYNSTSLVSPSQKAKSNVAQKQSKLSFDASHTEVHAITDKQSQKNLMSDPIEHIRTADDGHNNDGSFTSDCGDSLGLGSGLSTLTMGVTNSPSQTLSRRLHASKNSPRLSIVSAHAKKGNDADSVIGSEETDIVQSSLAQTHTNDIPNGPKNSELDTSLCENANKPDPQTQDLSNAETSYTGGRPSHIIQSLNALNREDLASYSTEDPHPKEPEVDAAADTVLKSQINRRNNDPFMSSPRIKRDNSFEEFLPSPKQKRACLRLERKENRDNGVDDSLLSPSGLTDDLDGCPEEISSSLMNGVHEDSDSFGGNPKPLASSKRNSLLHDATANFLARLASSKAAQGSKSKPRENLESGVRKSLQKFVFKAEKGQEETHDVSAAPKDPCPTKTSIFNEQTNLPLQLSSDDKENCISPPPVRDSTSCDDPEIVVCYDDELGSRKCNQKSKLAYVSLDSLRTTFAKRSKSERLEKKVARNFHAKISPADNRNAEAELNKVLSKDMFAKMKILGQFNLGFLITQVDRDLFIIDQHATDEKYNFETLQQTCILRHQPLIQPQKLQLTPANETVLVDNMEIFSANGFEFDIDESLPFGERVKLKSVPQSRNWSFGKDDIDELIFMLSDAPGAMCRPSRVRAMFASRACRTSVMVGTALSKHQMRDLVDHMGQIEQPWNCPHGRPTVRHLLNLDMVSK